MENETAKGFDGLVEKIEEFIGDQLAGFKSSPISVTVKWLIIYWVVRMVIRDIKNKR